MAYTTQPGTIPHRVVEYFKALPPDTERTTAAICEDLDIDPGSLVPCMEGPLKHGLMARRKVPGERALRWSLGDGTAPAAPEPDVLPQRIVITPAANPKEERSAPRQAKAEAKKGFDAWLSASGAMVLQGLQLDTDGDAMLAPSHVDALRKLLGAPA